MDGLGEEGRTSSAGGAQAGSSGKSKKQRLIWTAELHARFLSAVHTLGIKNAVPKTILQMMAVDGMTRENVASHLQKYRLYLEASGRAAAERPSAAATRCTRCSRRCRGSTCRPASASSRPP